MSTASPAPSSAADTASHPAWHIRGHVVIGCNCDFGCPCNFNGLPTLGKCEGNWNWHIEEGHYGDLSLAGLNVSMAVNWPGAIHEGGGEAILLIDERCDERQRDALVTITSGRAGGPWKIIATTIDRLHDPQFVPYEFELDGYNSRVKAGDYITLDMQPIRNRVTQAQVHPRAILPEGFIVKEADLGASITFRVDGPVPFDHSGRYAAMGPFEYQGP